VNYWKRLKRHPGVGYATMFALMGAMAGLQREGAGLEQALRGAGIMGVFVWLPVLITNMERNK
jgi:hypothetical protein